MTDILKNKGSPGSELREVKKIICHNLVTVHAIIACNSLKCGCNSVVECQLPKLEVAGSNPVARFNP